MDIQTSDIPGTRRETAAYIAALAEELARIADAQDFALLRYLLEMARQEAYSIAHSDAGGGFED